ncbi:hypothetical protein BCO37747_07194 [Burkholderia contaminans]|uniref:Uncharacterized protein n=4 Tax=Burkholderia cepacia complex TaxID=87882 RepID=A0A286P6U6_9BURK|nr:hypothetical protein BCCH1_80710 [Burkholderia contaminans]CAB3973571.1 hypothetical protein BLA3211_07568 [Burkholderia aenigmatica]CAB3976118.1 hypothetical protein BCO9919_07474 [Burkholderia cenocepacia]VWD60031.1 hypothetical protein BCO37747_07194 [Burkholderia contaminans]
MFIALEQAAHPTPPHQEGANPPEETLDITQLRDRGWTRQMVTRFLGVADARRPATPGAGGRPAELYRISRVRNAERMVAFSEARRTAVERSALARRSQQDRRESVLRFATAIELVLPDQSFDTVMRRARDAHAPENVGGDLDDGRRAVQLLLASLEDSTNRLDVFQGQPGIRDARCLLLDRKLSLISSRYPALSDWCERVKSKQVRDDGKAEPQ